MAALYIVGELFGRGRLRRLGQAIRRGSRQQPTLTSLVAGELDEMLGEVTSDSDRRSLVQACRRQSARDACRRRMLVTKSDLDGGVLEFLVSLPCQSACGDSVRDLRRCPACAAESRTRFCSRCCFISGYLWARYTLSRPWLVGLCVSLPESWYWRLLRSADGYAASLITRMSWP